MVSREGCSGSAWNGGESKGRYQTRRSCRCWSSSVFGHQRDTFHWSEWAQFLNTAFCLRPLVGLFVFSFGFLSPDPRRAHPCLVEPYICVLPGPLHQVFLISINQAGRPCFSLLTYTLGYFDEIASSSDVGA